MSINELCNQVSHLKIKKEVVNVRTKVCKNGENCTFKGCTFAHSLDEFNPKECFTGDYCEDMKCQYFHPTLESKREFLERTGQPMPKEKEEKKEEDIPKHITNYRTNYRTRGCKYVEYCANSDCTYAHSLEELQPRECGCEDVNCYRYHPHREDKGEFLLRIGENMLPEKRIEHKHPCIYGQICTKIDCPFAHCLEEVTFVECRNGPLFLCEKDCRFLHVGEDKHEWAERLKIVIPLKNTKKRFEILEQISRVKEKLNRIGLSGESSTKVLKVTVPDEKTREMLMETSIVMGKYIQVRVEPCPEYEALREKMNMTKSMTNKRKLQDKMNEVKRIRLPEHQRDLGDVLREIVGVTYYREDSKEDSKN